MNTDWLDAASSKLDGLWINFSRYLQGFAQPRRAARLRQLVIVSGVVWGALAGARLVWVLLPQPEQPRASVSIANPLGAAGASSAEVDIEALVSWNLFGDLTQTVTAAGAIDSENAANPPPAPGRDIEKNAGETRLPLVLRGVVASSDEVATVAIIEYRNSQKQYGPGDKLPVSGSVTVAKILPDRVVLDNGGNYELLKLFDKDVVSAQPMRSAASESGRVLYRHTDRDVAQLAESYRERLYRDPRSLTDVVKIAAVRSEGQLQGYRIAPGADQNQFERLGFRAGDVVTAVNGIQLTDPGKAMELYRVMRNAPQASFEVRRGDELVNIAVNFDPAVAR